MGTSREPVEMKKGEGEGGGNHRLDMLLGHKSKPSSWIGWRNPTPRRVRIGCLSSSRPAIGCSVCDWPARVRG